MTGFPPTQSKWPLVRLEKVVTLNPKHDRRLGDSLIVSFLPMSGVDDQTGTVQTLVDRPYGEVRKGYTHMADGDVIFAKITPCMENGKCAVVRGLTNGLGCGSTEFFVLRPNEALLPEYLHAFLRQQTYRDEARAVMTGAVGQARVPKQFVLDTQIPLPPLAEQRRIVTRIEEIMERSQRAAQASVEASTDCSQLRSATLLAAVTGQLTKAWRQDHRLNQQVQTPAPVTEEGVTPQLRRLYPILPSNWQLVRWQDVGRCQNGRAFPSKEYTTEGCRLLRPGNLARSGWVEWNDANTRFIPETWAAKYPTYLVGGGDIIMNLTAQSLKDEFLGRVCIAQDGERCLLNQRLARIIPVKIIPEFAYLLFRSPLFRWYVDTLNTGSLIQHMFTSQVYNFKFPLPPEDEQRAIVNIARESLRRISLIEEHLKESAEQLKTLQAAALSTTFGTAE